MNPIRIILADDHAIVRDGIKALLETENDIQVVGEASNGIEALKLAKELAPDIVVMDIRMPEMNGIEATQLLPRQDPQVKSLILSMHDMEEYVLRSIDSGAYGYLLKDTTKEEFIKALHTIYKGDKYFSSSISNVLVNSYINKKSGPADASGESQFELTRRELQILRYVVGGLSNKEIAEKLEKSVRTVETHRFNIMKKLNAKNIAELIRIAKEQNLL
jgi:DNA-binding NarL/FixJ family response regulator